VFPKTAPTGTVTAKGDAEVAPSVTLFALPKSYSSPASLKLQF